MSFKKGDIVETKYYGYKGEVVEKYINWEDLKDNNIFHTIDPDNIGADMDDIERIINTDPRDRWLNVQEYKYSESQLSESWYSVKLYSGGGVWVSESRLNNINYILN